MGEIAIKPLLFYAYYVYYSFLSLVASSPLQRFCTKAGGKGAFLPYLNIAETMSGLSTNENMILFSLVE